MTNKYLEKIAGLSGIGNAIKTGVRTVSTAMGKDYKPLVARAQKLSGLQAEHSARAAAIGSIGNRTPGMVQGSAAARVNEIGGAMSAKPHVDAHNKAVNRLGGKIKDLQGKANNAELNMRRAQAQVGKGAVAAGAVGLGAGMALKSNRQDDNNGY
jgi:hypothetical protein